MPCPSLWRLIASPDVFKSLGGGPLHIKRAKAPGLLCMVKANAHLMVLGYGYSKTESHKHLMQKDGIK